MLIRKWRDDLAHLIYPESCLFCADELPDATHPLCLFCRDNLQFTRFEEYRTESPLDQLFWGRIPVHGSYALLHYDKDAHTRRLLHALKYKHREDLGTTLGKMIGERISELKNFKDLDALLPVPLHPKKMYLRGYNQSSAIARGIASEMDVQVDERFLRRTRHGSSQTKKGRFGRWDNVQQTFALQTKSAHSYKHVALVDDVITTGATLESIIRQIHENYPDLRVSVIALALTR